MIEFKNVSIQYIKDFYALFNKSYAFSSNTLIIGDAIDGASAIMRIMSKIDKSYSGEVFVDNKNLRDIKDKDLPLAYVPESAELFKARSILFNLCYPFKIRKIKNAKELVSRTLKELDLEEFIFNFNNLKIKTYRLNKSEQKITALLRAVIRRPKYLLIENLFKDLDEKYLNLAMKILEKAKQFSLIIACEETSSTLEIFKDFEVITL